MSEAKRKIYGIPLTDDHNNCFGITVDENGRYVGRHTSSNYSFLKMDLWKDRDANYVFRSKPTYEQLCFLIFSIVSGFEDEIEVLKEQLKLAESQIDDLKQQVDELNKAVYQENGDD